MKMKDGRMSMFVTLGGFRKPSAEAWYDQT
jgi:hypothetical protein